MFIGRKKELASLDKCISVHQNALLYGPRRVGKSTLLKEFISTYPHTVIWHECVRGSFEYNMELLSSSAARILHKPYIASMKDIFDLFALLGESGTPILVVIDEYPYLKDCKEQGAVDSFFQRIIDSQYNNLSIILSGSCISIMRELLEEDNPLYGRFQLIIPLKPFDYYEASAFYPALTPMEKIRFYSVFGGYPFALEKIDAAKSLEENIENLLLDEYGPIYQVIENVLLAEIGKGSTAREIISKLGNSRKKYQEISDSLSINSKGTLDRDLKKLIAMEIIEKNYPVNKKTDKKKAFYEISDNLLRFCYTYIFKNKSALVLLGAHSFLKAFITPSLSTFISKRFESLVKEYFARRAKDGALGAVISIGSYWYDDKLTHTNGEFDCVLEHSDHSVDIYEVKLLQSPMSLKQMEAEKTKVEAIKELNVHTIGFVSASGFEALCPEIVQITGEQLYETFKTQGPSN